MFGIDPTVICHKLSINADAKPEKQKPRGMNEERSRAISEEVDRLLQAGFIRETFYPDWLFNHILVGNGELESTLPTSLKLARRTVIPFEDRLTSGGDSGLPAP